VAAALTETGLEPSSAHVPLSKLEGEIEPLLEQYDALGCSHLVIPHLSAMHFLTQRRIETLAERLRDLAERLDDDGFELVIHNGQGMHRPVFGRYGTDQLVEADAVPTGGWVYLAQGLGHIFSRRWHDRTGFFRLASALESAPVSFEIDIRHAVCSGQDPEQLFAEVADRLFAVHLSDGARTRRLPPAYRPVPLGDGIIDIEQSIRQAIYHEADWLIGEVEGQSNQHQVVQPMIDAIEPTYNAAYQD
jgi:sugar phosphate isomerase/epimerase